MDFDWKKLVGTVAPALATALGGPLAGMAVKTISESLGASEGTEEAVAAKLAGATPADLLALKDADQKFQLEMRRLEIDLQKTVVQAETSDRASARQREIATQDWTPRILAGLIVITWGLVQWYLLHGIIAAEMREIVMRVLGTLDAALMLCLSYYFGASVHK